MKRRKHVGKLIKILSILIEKEFNKISMCYDLTSTQSMVLFYIQKNKFERISPVDIEKSFNFSHPTILGILKRLEDKKFIKTSKSNIDQRYTLIEITEKGNDVEKEIHSSLKVIETKLFSNISDEERLMFMEIINKMILNLTEETNA